MNLIISLLYAPLVFLSLRYFDITNVAICIFILSTIWFILVFKKGYKELLYPSLYIVISLFTFFLKDFLLLKTIPLLVSSFITIFILISYINKQSLILYFAKKFSKKEISLKEEEYIHKSTLFWFFVSSINVIIHLYIYLDSNMNYWIYYSSIGWYFIFIFAGLLQYLHKRFIFSKDLNA
ncbi:MAG: hypothetical protein C0625_11310 [Arcobacter sp.]|nr:MAG: hypothetical protein C0625_11310 [Arcobacter sp.]